MVISFFFEDAWLKAAVTCDFVFLPQNTLKNCYLQEGGHMLNDNNVHWETHHWKYIHMRKMCFCFFWQLQWELDLDQIKNRCCPLLMENYYFFIGSCMIMRQVLWNTPFLPKCVNGPELGCKITLSSSMSDTSAKLSLWLLRYARTLWRWCQSLLHTVHIRCNPSLWAVTPVPYTSSPCCTHTSLPQSLLSCTLENCNLANLLLSLRAKHLCSY